MTELKFMWPEKHKQQQSQIYFEPSFRCCGQKLECDHSTKPSGPPLLLIVWYQCVFVIKLLRISRSRTFTLSSLKWELKGLIAISICLATLQVVTILVATGA